MQKLKLYAVHADGRSLYYPQWDADGEIINTKHPTAAVSIDQNLQTFPAGLYGSADHEALDFRQAGGLPRRFKAKRNENQAVKTMDLLAARCVRIRFQVGKCRFR